MGETDISRRSGLVGGGSVGVLWLVTEALRFFGAEREESRKQQEHERELERQELEHTQQMDARRQQTDLERSAYQQIIEACTEGRFNWGN